MHNRILLPRRLWMAVVIGLAAFASAAHAQWSAMTDLPLSRTFAMTAASNDKVWLFGGAQTAQLGPTGIPTNNSAQAWVRNTNGGAWNAIASMPAARAAGYAAYINNKIYIVGGVHAEGTALAIDGAALEFDPANNSYSTKSTMPTPVFGFAGAVVNNKIYVIGGVALSGSNYAFPTTVQIYDPATDSWSTSSIDAPYSAVYPAATAVGENIYLVGGVNTSSFASRNSAYKGTVTPTGVTWTTIANYPQALSGHGGGTLNGTPYFAGGQTDAGAALRNAYYYDNTSSSWKGTYWLPRPLVHASSLPSDGTSLYYLSTSDGVPTPYKFAKGPMDVPVAEATPASLVLTVQTGQGAQATITVLNTGVVNLTGNVSTPAGDAWLSVSGATTVNVAAGANAQYLVSVNASSLTEGTYTSTITVNSNDPDHSALTIPVKLYVRDELVQQATRVVLEESSGAWCGPCGAYGVPEVKRLVEKYGESLIAIALHDRGGRGATADTLATTKTEDLGNLLKVQAFPNASVSRYTFSGNTGPMMDLSNWDGGIQAILDNVPFAPVAMEIKSYKWDNNARTVRATIELTTATALNLGSNTLNVTGVMLEDSIRYSQNGQSDPFYHMHAVRDFWPGITGQEITIPAAANDDGIIPPGTKLTVNVVFTPAKFARANQCHMVFFTHINNGSNLGPILQGTEIGLTESVDSASGGEVSFTTPTRSINVQAGQEAMLETTVMNGTTAPVELTLTRTDNSIPSGWTSLFCLNNQCTTVPTSDGPVTYTLAPGQTTKVAVKVTPSSAGSGTVTLRVRNGSDNQTHDETYTVTATQDPGGVRDAVVGNSLMSIAANTPNPASDLTSFAITLARPTSVTVDVIAIDGTPVLQIPTTLHNAGTFSQVLNVASLPAGTYTVRFSAGGQGLVRTINVVR